MDSELSAAQKENVVLKSKLRIANFPTEQATNCGRCEKYSHTPWKDDEYGYVCATCLVDIKDAQLEKLTHRLRACNATANQIGDEWLATQPDGIRAAIANIKRNSSEANAEDSGDA